MKRYLALDIGDARIGVAVCLNDLGIVTPLTVFARTKSIKADVRGLAQIILDNKIDMVVIGLPVSDREEQMTKNCEFAERLMRRSEMPPYEYWNEAYTTVRAEEELIEMGASRQKRKAVIDQSAAVLILESYLASKENI